MSTKKTKKIVIGLIGAALLLVILLFWLLPGVRVIGPLARFQVKEDFYLYDMETETIIGTVPMTLQGFFEEFTGTFRGTACIEGYELQYPRDKYSGQMDGDEIVFWLHDSEMTYKGSQQWDTFYGKHNYYIRVCRNHENRIVWCILTQNEGFREDGGSYSGRYYALQAKDEASALALMQAHNEEMEKQSAAMMEKFEKDAGPGVHYQGDAVYVNVEQEFYQYDLDGQLIGTIPVKFKGWLKYIQNDSDFDGTVEVEGYQLQYVERGVSENHFSNAVMLDDTKNGYIHLIISGLKLVQENVLPSYVNSDYQYNITICKEESDAIIVRVGQLEKVSGGTGHGYHYPTMFYAVLAENAEVGAQLIASEVEYEKQNSTQQETTEPIPSETISTEPVSTEPEGSGPEYPEHLCAVGDINGDGKEESLTLRDFDDLGIQASLWVNDEKVLDLQGQGELSEYSCRLATVDMDKDGQDEVLVFVRVAADINDASFRYIQWDGETWQEWPKVPLPKLEMTLDKNWQCTLTDGTEAWTVEVINPTLRAEWFDEAGTPVAGPMQAGAFTSNADHIIEEDKIIFNAHVSVRDLGDKGGSWDDIWGEPTVTVSYENGQLVTDDALCQVVLKVLAKTGE